jgi:hypothetical protein
MGDLPDDGQITDGPVRPRLQKFSTLPAGLDLERATPKSHHRFVNM